MIDILMRIFFGWYFNRVIECCASVCDKNSFEADEFYGELRGIAPDPTCDMGVLKYACYAGQASRDAHDIRKLKRCPRR
jgi:hypothetical protein